MRQQEVPKLLDSLSQCLSDGGRLRTQKDFSSQEEFLAYGSDRSKLKKNHFLALAEPVSVKEIAALLSFCYHKRQAIRITGGRTGLSGGAMAQDKEIVLSLARMDRLLGIDPLIPSIRVEAGMVTQNAEQHAREHDLAFPIDLAASGSSQIGGNLATHAGGMRVLRYGLLRSHVLGLKVVTGKGEILTLEDHVLKNNAGYNLRSLFVGSEGSLGVIAEAHIRLVRAPKEPRVALLLFSDLENSLLLLSTLQNAGLSPLAYEYFDEASLQIVCKTNGLPNPFSEKGTHYTLLEWDAAEFSEAELLEIFTNAVEAGALIDARMAEGSAAQKRFWSYREGISEALSMGHEILKNDVSLPLSYIAQFTRELKEYLHKMHPEIEGVMFGHLGDGNLHINLRNRKALQKSFKKRAKQSLPSEEFQKEAKVAEAWIAKRIFSMQGSMSAEHGIGITKKQWMNDMHGKTELTYMKKIKDIFDPHGILNHGVLF